MADPSLRFFNFVTTLPGVASYLPHGMRKYKQYQVFRLKCIANKKYIDYIANTQLGEDPLLIDNKIPPVKILPPKFTQKDIDRIYALKKDPKVHYIVLPMLLDDVTVSCKKQVKRDQHMILMAYNKSLRVIELWDDHYPYNQVQFEYVYIPRYIKRFRGIFETFGMPVRTSLFPMVPETKVDQIRSLLEAYTKKPTFYQIYEAFLVNYLRKRVEEMAKRTKTVRKTQRIAIELSPPPAGAPKKKDKVSDKIEEEKIAKLKNAVNEVGKYVVPKRKDLVTKFLNTYDGFLNKQKLAEPSTQSNQVVVVPCPEGEYKDVLANECKPVPKDINIPQDYVGNKMVFQKHPVAYFAYIFTYLMNKHPSMTTIVPKRVSPFPQDYAISWIYSKTAQRSNKWSLIPPKPYKRFMKKALADDQVRFISLFLHIEGITDADIHLNSIILDKTTKTFIRFEPNAGYKNYYADRGMNNGVTLDEELSKLFSEHGFKLYDWGNACPLGVHRIQWDEASNVFDIGGNCALWSIWLLDLYLSNPDVDPKIVLTYASQEIKRYGSFKHFINGYTDFLVRGALKSRGKLRPRA
jgi:anti-sigma28 factor (negative regulator of flagellin synthesis)